MVAQEDLKVDLIALSFFCDTYIGIFIYLFVCPRDWINCRGCLSWGGLHFRRLVSLRRRLQPQEGFVMCRHLNGRKLLQLIHTYPNPFSRSVFALNSEDCLK